MHPTETTGRHHGNRHGRSESARKAVLEAADDLLAERGFAGFTIEGLALRAGVSKQTIYRWWKTKTDILVDTYLDDAAEHLVPPDLGALDRDLRAHLRNLVHFLRDSDSGMVLRALIAQTQHDPAIATAFRNRCLRPQRERDRIPLQRAMIRGELAAETDIDAALDRLIGPIYYRVLVSGEDIDDRFIDELIEMLLRTFGNGIN
ncbi:TetR/AcrR family transcriptional regulator [Nocardia arthritidis]|uniref:TetR family transcriptional regulator n=1 Tax=Nocardia arthritidis TaxID=228602 RepID=A0A6G9YNK3_9NOCA|nr:TetR/AcrR family transcriptional regulator [Nocardia arthritidis]QIS14503.1 TetR family transcriptional regulator [Nocardia arthritidis]